MQTWWRDCVAYFLRPVLFCVNPVKRICTHLPFYGGKGSVRVGDGLTLRGLPYQPLSVLQERNNGRRGPLSFRAWNHGGTSVFHECDTGIGCSEINANQFGHVQNPPRRNGDDNRHPEQYTMEMQKEKERFVNDC